MLIKQLIFILLATITLTQNVLSTIQFNNNVVYTTNRIHINSVGLSFSYPQIFNNLSSTLLRAYIKNSYVYSLGTTGFRISMKMQDPKGYKYNCAAYTELNANSTCIRNLTSTDFTSMNAFTRATIPGGFKFHLGFDMQYANFSNSNFLNKVYSKYSASPITTVLSYNSQYGSLQAYDQADQFQAKGIRQKFNTTDFLNQAKIAYFQTLWNIVGPGLSINSGKDWIDTFYQWTMNAYGYFTLYAQPFVNLSDVTIPNLLNQSYYRLYIQNRLTGNSGTVDLSPYQYGMAFTDVRIVGGDGVSGVTDTMAAAIWALDFSMQSVLFGLKYVLFNNDMSATNVQSPLGNSPNFTPRAIYYGMLMMSIINSQGYSFTTQTVTAGTSGSIKVYGFYALSLQGFLLINKDTNPNASGVVQINFVSGANMSCIYMSASSLQSKNITIGGYYFISGNASIQGSFNLMNYTSDDYGYKIPLNYAQAAYCYTTNQKYLFSKDVLTLNQSYHQIIPFILVLYLILSF